TVRRMAQEPQGQYTGSACHPCWRSWRSALRTIQSPSPERLVLPELLCSRLPASPAPQPALGRPHRVLLAKATAPGPHLPRHRNVRGPRPPAAATPQGAAPRHRLRPGRDPSVVSKEAITQTPVFSGRAEIPIRSKKTSCQHSLRSLPYFTVVTEHLGFTSAWT